MMCRTAAAFLAVLALVAGACGGGSAGGDAAGAPRAADTAAGGGTETSPTPTPPAGTGDSGSVSTDGTAGDEPGGATGGELILAVEQWPECLNPVTSCANASWTLWSVTTHVLPRLMELDLQNNYRASPTLLEEPTNANGGLQVGNDGAFTLTYRLRSDAIWSDGTPMTSTDVWYTWRARLDTAGTLDTAGYQLITAVNTDDPQVAVVTFSEPYAPWRTSSIRCCPPITWDPTRTSPTGGTIRSPSPADRGCSSPGARTSTSWCPTSSTGTPSAGPWWTAS